MIGSGTPNSHNSAPRPKPIFDLLGSLLVNVKTEWEFHGNVCEPNALAMLREPSLCRALCREFNS